MGERTLGPLTDRERQMATGFAGGLGMSLTGSCGAFSAGVMVLGAHFGRTSPKADDTRCQEAVAAFRKEFRTRFETVNCGELREEKYGSGGREPCSVLVERASRLLLEILDEHSQKDGGH